MLRISAAGVGARTSCEWEKAMAVNSFLINVNSEQPVKMRAFYRDVVGLKPHPDMGEGAMMAAQTPFIIDGHDAVHGATEEQGRRLHNFFVDDLAAEQKRMEAAGVKFIRTAGREPWGGFISTFFDPDGDYGQLIEYKP